MSIAPGTPTAERNAFAGGDLFFDRLQRARELPPERRTGDTDAFLASCQLLEEAADVLDPERLSSQGPSSEEQLLALLKWLCVSTGMGPRQVDGLYHPSLERVQSAVASVAPLVQLEPGRLASISGRPTELLRRLQRGDLQPLSDLSLLASLLLLVRVTGMAGRWTAARSLVHVALAALEQRQIERSIDGQLQALRGEAAQRDGGGWQPPSLAELHAIAWSMLSAACPHSEDEGEEELRRKAVAELLRWDPGNPGTHSMAGMAAEKAALASWDAGTFRRAERHFRRGLELAHQRGSPFWQCKLCYQLVALAVSAGLDNITVMTPRATAATLEAAEQAYARCRGVLPWVWTTQLTRVQREAGAGRQLLLLHLERSPERWLKALYHTQLPGHAASVVREYGAALEASEGNSSEASRCDHCGMPALVIKTCSRCRIARYCGELAGECARHPKATCLES